MTAKGSAKEKSVVQTAGKSVKKVVAPVIKAASHPAPVIKAASHPAPVIKAASHPAPVIKAGSHYKNPVSPKLHGSKEHFEDAYDTSEWIIGTVVLIFLFFALSPGVLLTLPPGRGRLWMSGTTSITAALVHSVLLVALLNYI